MNKDRSFNENQNHSSESIESPHSAHVTGFVFDDGGRVAAGYKGSTGDCVVRAIAITSGKPYQEVYDAINVAAKRERRKRGKSNARSGVHRTTYQPYLESLGFKWMPTMKIGQGCKVHLCANELPMGRLVVAVSKHLTAVIDGVIHDTGDPRRGPTYWYKDGKVDHVSPDRCVYGYYTAPVTGSRNAG